MRSKEMKRKAVGGKLTQWLMCLLMLVCMSHNNEDNRCQQHQIPLNVTFVPGHTIPCPGLYMDWPI